MGWSNFVCLSRRASQEAQSPPRFCRRIGRISRPGGNDRCLRMPASTLTRAKWIARPSLDVLIDGAVVEIRFNVIHVHGCQIFGQCVVHGISFDLVFVEVIAISDKVVEDEI